MADVIALRAVLTWMGFRPACATFITDTQGMNNLEEFRLLDDDTAQNLCKLIHRPGGMMDNAAFVAGGGTAAAAASGIPEWVPHPGFLISTRAEMNLQLMCYFLHYQEHTLRVAIAADITLAAVQSIRAHKGWEESHEDVEPPEINDKDWACTFESIDEWLHGCLGETSKTHLAYIVCDCVTIIPDPTAPAIWPSKVDELIGHAHIVMMWITISLIMSKSGRRSRT